MDHKIKGLTAGRLSLVLTIIALILWSYSISQSRLVIDDFGLLRSFPITYFIALAILTIASFILWRSRESHNGLLFLQLSALIASLLLVPILIGGGHRGDANFPGVFQFTTYVIEYEHLNPDFHWYHVFPISWIFSAEIIEVLGIQDLYLFHKIIAFACQFIYLPVVYVFLRNTLGKDKSNYCWAGLWLFYLAEWLGFSGLGPQSFGWFFFLLMLALFSIVLTRRPSIRSVGYRIIIILTFASITFSHWLSAAFCWAAAMMVFFRKRLELGTVIIFTVLIASWIIYYATTFFEYNLAFFVEHAFRLGEIWQYSFVERVTVINPAHAFLNQVRTWYTVLFLVIGFLGFILGLTANEKKETHLTILAIGIGIVALASTVGFSYKHEIIDKTYLFGIPLIAYFGANLLNRKATALLLCIILVIAPPIYIASHYANQLSDLASPANREGFNFVKDHGTAEGTISGNYYNWGSIKWSDSNAPAFSSKPVAFVVGRYYLEHPELYQGVLFEQLRFEHNQLHYREGVQVIYPHYIAVSQRDKGIYYWNFDNLDFVNDIEKSLNNARNCNLVYTNPDMVAYVVEGSAD